MADKKEQFDNYKELADYSLDPEAEQKLLKQQKECTFIWATKDGSPMGVIMTYLAAKEKIWLLVTEKRARVAAVRRDPRSCVVISSAGLSEGTGKTITYKGNTKVHTYDSPAVKDWLYQDYVAKLHREGNQDRIDFFKGVLAIPERVVLEFTPTNKLTFDGDKMAARTPGASGKFDDMWK